jgi:hypothetical protein
MPLATLKSKNQRVILGVLVANMVVIWLILSGKDLALAVSSLPGVEARILKSAAIASLGSAIALIINHVVSPQVKAMLVFWRLKNVLPGHRAFSELLDVDPRIDRTSLTKALGRFPSSPRDQNTLWYRLLKKHESSPVIMESHQHFLLLRDLTAMSCLLLLPVLMAGVLEFAQWAQVGTCLTVLALEYIFIRLAAKNAGERLVGNVLAIESILQT